jgi:hypothetical protein
MRTQKDLSNIILKAQCCVADMAYKSLKQEMFLKADASRIHKNVKFLHALVNILNRYYDVVYVLNDTDVWLTSDQIEDILQQINLLCDNCGCCSSRQVLSMQPSLPLPTNIVCNLNNMNFAVCFDSGTSTFKAFVASNVNTIPYTQYYYEYAVSEDDVVWDDIPNEHSWLLSTPIDTDAYVSVRVRVYCKQGDSTYTEIVRTIKDPNSALTFNDFGFINVERIGTNAPITSDLYIFDDDTVTIKNLNTNFTIASITNVNTSVVLAANTNSYTNLASNMVSDGDQILVKFKINSDPTFTCLTESVFTVHIVPKLDPNLTFKICPGSTTYVYIDDLYDSYLWDNDDTNYYREVDAVGSYTVTATTGTISQTVTFDVTLETESPTPIVVDATTEVPITSPYIVVSPDSIEMKVKDIGMYSGGYPVGTIVAWVGYGVPGDEDTTVSSTLGSEFVALVTVPGIDCPVYSNTVTVVTRSMVFIPTPIKPICPGESNGRIDIVPGTTADSFIYEIYDGATLLQTITSAGGLEIITGLPAGTYSVIGTAVYVDGINATSSPYTVIITDPPAITSINYTSTNITCNGNNDGSISSLSVTGGVSPYVYFLNGIAIPNTGLNNLASGDYIISVIDNGGEGCEFIGDTITILEPDPITVFPTIGNTTGGLNNGTASFSIGGGSGTYPTLDLYNFDFSTLIGSGLSFTGLAAGDYNYVIVDTNGCNTIFTFTIT